MSMRLSPKALFEDGKQIMFDQKSQRQDHGQQKMRQRLKSQFFRQRCDSSCGSEDLDLSSERCDK